MTENKLEAKLQKSGPWAPWAPLADELLKHGRFPVTLLEALSIFIFF